MSTILNGVAVNEGIPLTLAGTGIGGSTTVARLFQSIDHEKTADTEDVRDENGSLAARYHYNPGEKATLVYFAASITGTNTLADAILKTTIPAKGVIVTVAACTQYPALNNTAWEVMSAKMKGTNTSAKEITLDVEFHAAITGPVS